MSRNKTSNPDTLGSLVKDGLVTELGWEYIYGLARTVAFRYYRTYDTEDLISMALTDLAEFLIQIEHSDNIPNSVRNVLFTRARNAMSNYLYHRRKDVPTEDELLDTNASKEYSTDKEKSYDFTFSSNEEAHWLSLKLWRIYNGEEE